MIDDIHAAAVASAAREADEQGNIEKATALFRSILQYHPLSDEATGALEYLAERIRLPPLSVARELENRSY